MTKSKDHFVSTKLFLLKRSLMIFVFLGIAFGAFSQALFKSKVIDEQGEPIIGASIKVKAANSGTITDQQGAFSLDLKGNEILIVSYIGYLSQEINVAGKNNIVIKLIEDNKTLTEVVVVGFGTQKKVNLTGAVSTASAKDFEGRAVNNAVQALQGIVPGLNITNKGLGGELNNTPSIDIRGTGTIGQGSNSSPLILIDGMDGSIGTLNPQDIESISVLKDAAASSIYGSRAAFGVILVTTKKGKSGRASVNYNNSFRFQTPIMLPEMQNSWEFFNYYDDAQFNATNSHLFNPTKHKDATQNGFEAYKKRIYDYYTGVLDPKDAVLERTDGKWEYDYPNGNVNWLKEYYKKWSPSQEHNLSISGGGDKTTYYISSNYLSNNGFMRYGADDLNRMTSTAKISSQLSNILKLDASVRFTRQKYDKANIMDETFYNNVMRRARPLRAKLDPNGFYMGDINYINDLENGGRHSEVQDALYQQAKFTLTPVKDWNIIGEVNIRTNNNKTHTDRLPTFSHYANDPTLEYTSLVSTSNSSVYEYRHESTYVNPNIYSNYTKSFDRHNFSVMAGFQSETFNQTILSGQRQDLISNDLPALSLSTSATSYAMSGYPDKWATAGFFGRINYNFDGKYLVELNNRYDGTSRFRSDKRWIWTPSASIGWNVARESFFEPLSEIVSNFKLRASYGVLGNQNTSSWYPTYQTIGTFTAAAANKPYNGYYPWLVNGALPNVAWAPSLTTATTDLTWEKVKTTNYGLDFGFFNNRLAGSFDYFIRITENMVGPGLILPSAYGTSAAPTVNNTDMRSHGWELDIAWKDVVGDLKYGVRVNVSDSRSKITRYSNPTGSLSAYVEGQYTGNIYAYETVGIAKTNDEMIAHLASLPNGGQTPIGSNWAAGDIMYKDRNGDGVINGGKNTISDMGDRKLIGNSNPRFRTGVTLDLSWKGFDMQMLWQGVLKRDFMPAEGSMMFWGVNGGGEFWSTGLKQHLDYFRADENHPLGANLDAYYPRALFSNKNHAFQTKYLQDASYLRLKNLQIGYNLPKSLVNKMQLQGLRVFASAENLLTFTKLSTTMDPETAGIGVQGGTVYPLSKTFSVGLSVNL